MNHTKIQQHKHHSQKKQTSSIIGSQAGSMHIPIPVLCDVQTNKGNTVKLSNSSSTCEGENMSLILHRASLQQLMDVHRYSRLETLYVWPHNRA